MLPNKFKGDFMMLPEKDISNISHELYQLIFYIHSKVFNPTAMVKGLSIPPSNIKVIFHLVKRGPCPVSKIANELMISKSNMTPIIDNLISEGFVNRFDNPHDRRIIMVEATEKAFDLLRNREQKMKELLAEKISILEEEDLQVLQTMLPELTKVIFKIK